MSRKPEPQTEEEWIIHSINIHGLFFERWCQEIVDKATGWEVQSTYEPVEFPPSTMLGSKEGHLDIRALYYAERPSRLITLPIECKKNNPDFVKWIFFPKRFSPKRPSLGPKTNCFYVREVVARRESPQSNVEVTSGLSHRCPFDNVPVADEARETRGTYLEYKKNDKTKTSNAAITEAAHQIALATQSLFFNATQDTSLSWIQQVFVPTIVTSAGLYTCDFDPNEVDPKTGEIPFNNAEITEQKFLLFEYALPKRLQLMPKGNRHTSVHIRPELYSRMQIVVVHSEYFAEFLDYVSSRAFYIFQ